MTTRRTAALAAAALALAAGAVAAVLPGAADAGAAASAATPTRAERAALVAMRQEEKLARDVYRTLSERWGVRIFATIARSEQRHMDAIGGLLARYGIPDPVAGLARGDFADPSLDVLYDQLVAQGATSFRAAAGVGVRIERLDLADLRRQLTRVDRPDIVRVLQHLSRGSQHHLAAFERLA
ncbi:MAG: DUF2202 domain-containing protein [Thermoleophilia bacterium]